MSPPEVNRQTRFSFLQLCEDRQFRAMTDTQSTPADGAAKEDPEARFFRSLIAVLKENREVLPRLPEIMECQIVNENQAPTLIERRKLEKSRYQSCNYYYYYHYDYYYYRYRYCTATATATTTTTTSS